MDTAALRNHYNSNILHRNQLNRFQIKGHLLTNTPQDDYKMQHRNANARRNRTVWYNVLYQMAEKFSNQTTVHGINQIFAPQIGRSQRGIWSITFLTSLAFLIYVSLVIAARYNKQKFETVIDTPKLGIYRLYFPEVTLCNANRLNWSRLNEAKQRFLSEMHHTQQYEDLFTTIMATFDTLIFGEFYKFEPIKNLELQVLDYINFTQVVHFMSWRCDEILTNCSWGHLVFDCCEIFLPRFSQLGYCLAFNTVQGDLGKLKELKDPYYPWRTANSGPGSALTLRFFVKEQNHSPYSFNDKGAWIMLTEPYVWYVSPVWVDRNAKIDIALDAIYNFFDNDTRSVPSSIRQCVFDYEQTSADFKTFSGEKYMFENCQAVCQQDYMIRYCNCSMDLFFPPDSKPVCKASSFTCFIKYNEYFQRFEQKMEDGYLPMYKDGMKCECFFNCFSLNYIKNMRVNSIPRSEQVQNNSYIDMDFYFQRNTLLLYRTKLVYTWIDLLVSFGGIVGLFLGCSLISFVEVGYFIFIDIPKWLWQQYIRNGNDNVNETPHWKNQKIEQSVNALVAKNVGTAPAADADVNDGGGARRFPKNSFVWHP